MSMCSANGSLASAAARRLQAAGGRLSVPRSVRAWKRLFAPEFEAWPVNEEDRAGQVQALADRLQALGCVMAANADSEETRMAAGLWRTLKYEYGPLIVQTASGGRSFAAGLAGAERAYVEAVRAGDLEAAGRWVRQLVDPAYRRFVPGPR